MVSKRNKTVVVVLTMVLVVLGGLLVVGPAMAQEDDEEDEEDDEDADAQLRFVHGVSDAPSVDVYIGGERVLQEVDPSEVSDYEEVEAGNHTVVMVGAEDPGGVVLETELEAEENGNYTVAATGQFESNETDAGEPDRDVEPVVLLDNATQPSDEFAAVRLAHLVQGAPDVTVTLNETGDVVYESLGYGEASSYQTIAEGDYTLDVRTGGEDGDVIATVDADLEGGEATSLLAIAAEDENETLQVLQETDPIGPEELTPDIAPSADGDDANETETDDEGTDLDETDEEGADLNETDEEDDVENETDEEDDVENETDEEDDVETEAADGGDDEADDDGGSDGGPDVDIGVGSLA